MLLIFGLKSYLSQLAIVTLVCRICGNRAAQRVEEHQRKFTLFFVPLFRVSRKYTLTCTFCAQTTSITGDLAQQYASSAGSGHGSVPNIESTPRAWNE